VEKREHQLTTTKLTALLRKRAAASDNEPAADIGLLHQQIGMLQQQLRSSQEKETQLRSELSVSTQQYEKLRQLTLEGFRAQRAELPLAMSTVASVSAQAPAAAPDPMLQTREVAPLAVPSMPTGAPDGGRPIDTAASEPATAAPVAAAVLSTVPNRAPPTAVVEALRMALQPQRLSSDMVCAQMWRRPSNHAQPRVGMTRSRSDLSSAAGDVTVEGAAHAASVGGSLKGASPSVTVSEVQPRPLSGAPMRRSVSELAPVAARARLGGLPSPVAADGAPAPVASAIPTPSPLASPLSNPLTLANGGGAASFGYPYVKGAICVEPPKRQRTVISVVQSPRATPHAATPHA